MNIYVVVEGEIGASKVYEKWINYLNPSLTVVYRIEDIKENNYFIKGGGGFPDLKNRIIKNSVEEINELQNIDRFVVAVDSEESTFDEKKKEFSEYIESCNCYAKYYLIVQHFCFETWALANRKAGPTYPKSEKLKEYKSFFDVTQKDPELLPSYPKLELNRSQFAYKYLITMLNDKYRNLSYSKTNTKAIQELSYFTEIKRRMEQTNHILSFKQFLEAFQEIK